MANSEILIDTSIIIDFLRKQKKENTMLWALQENYSCFMSAITLFELYAGAQSKDHFEDIQKIERWINAIHLNDEIAKLAASIYQSLKKQNEIIEFRDIFIGATAVLKKYQLATLNIKHFKRIQNLSLIELNSI